MEHAAENERISLIWKIGNYSYCIQGENECLESPLFEIPDRACKLLLYPRRLSLNGIADKVGLRLRLSAGAELYSGLDCELSVLTTSGSFKIFATLVVHSRSRKYTSPVHSFSKYELKDYLENDTLTIKCRISNQYYTQSPMMCCAHTVINFQKTMYHWKIKAECDSNKVIFPADAEPILSKFQDISLIAFLVKERSGGGKFQFIIKRSHTTKLTFLTMAISIVVAGKVLHSNYNENWFDECEGEQEWAVTFTPQINFTNYTKQDIARYLCLEIAISDDRSGTVTKIEHGAVEDVLRVVPEPSPHSVRIHSWKDNLQHYQSEGKLSDVTLRTTEKDFPAHKFLLCAQSKVFSAMFEHDTKENQTGIVEIEDLEDETVLMLLHYIYSGVFENYDWETAMKLYFAADKYEITAMKEQCSFFLKNNIETSNVCTCLIHADMHQDQPLKAFAQEFVVEHSSEVMKSEEWKELLKNNVNLAAETMHLFFSKNSI